VIRRIRTWAVVGLAAVATLTFTVGPVAAASPTLPTGEKGTVGGSGATFPSLLYKSWMTSFSRKNPATFDASGNPDKGIVLSYSAVGSGAGKKNFYGADARKSTQMFSGTDALLTADDVKGLNAVGAYVMIPTALGPVAIVYNLPGLKQKVKAGSTSTRAATLRLDGPTLGAIYSGAITKWNDPKIKALNPLITNLPSKAIEPVYRSDGSGTSFIFTSYLNKVSPPWTTALGNKPSQTMSDKIATLPSKANAVGAPGNEGVAATVSEDAGAIGYVELGFALQLGLKSAYMKTGDTSKQYFVPPTTAGAQAAAAVAYKAGTADDPLNPGTVDSGSFYQPVNQKGATSYPISGYTWVLLYGDYKGANDPGLAKTQALIGWIQWTLSANGGQATMSRLGYSPLPPNVRDAAIAQLHKITYGGTVVWP
jgi:phosphate transport system substrate-binding protein